jgi:hypothetical protein
LSLANDPPLLQRELVLNRRRRWRQRQWQRRRQRLQCVKCVARVARDRQRGVGGVRAICAEIVGRADLRSRQCGRKALS